jgi:hypothetical protein
MLRAVHSVAMVAAVVCATAGWAQVPDAAAVPALTAVLNHLAERTQQYYDRFISIICTETVRQQDLRRNLAPAGKPRVTVFELSVSRDPKTQDANDLRIERTLLSVNGRAAKKNQQPGCTDPKTGTPEPLSFLLEKNQPRFRFALNERAVGGPAGARALSFIQSPPEPVSVKWTANCFNAEGGGQEGRVWFDPVTFDVLQVEARLSTPFHVRVPQISVGIQSPIFVERAETTVRFERVAFEKPDEIVLLPQSVETLTVFRGATSLRTEQKLTNFRRFLAESTIHGITF